MVAIAVGTSNAFAEEVQSKILAMKGKAGGYRKREYFKIAIDSYFDGLILYPQLARIGRKWRLKEEFKKFSNKS